MASSLRLQELMEHGATALERYKKEHEHLSAYPVLQRLADSNRQVISDLTNVVAGVLIATNLSERTSPEEIERAATTVARTIFFAIEMAFLKGADLGGKEGRTPTA